MKWLDRYLAGAVAVVAAKLGHMRGKLEATLQMWKTGEVQDEAFAYDRVRTTICPR